MVPLYIMRSIKTSDLNTLELLEGGMNLSLGIWDHLDCAVVSANCFSFLADLLGPSCTAESPLEDALGINLKKRSLSGQLSRPQVLCNSSFFTGEEEKIKRANDLLSILYFNAKEGVRSIKRTVIS